MSRKSPFSMTPARERVVAYHEAGHALAHWHYGEPIEQATVVPSHEYQGVVVGAPYSHSPCEPRERLQRQVIISLAGPAAQRLYAPRSGICQSASVDHKNSDALLRALSTSPESEQALERWAYYTARDLVKGLWHVIEAVAQALLDRKTLTGDECFTIADAAEERHSAALAALRPAVMDIPSPDEVEAYDSVRRAPKATRRHYADALLRTWIDRVALGAASPDEREAMLTRTAAYMNGLYQPADFRARLEGMIAQRERTACLGWRPVTLSPAAAASPGQKGTGPPGAPCTAVRRQPAF